MGFTLITLKAIGVYLLIGLIFALIFVVFGVSKVDQDAKGSGLGFRLIILPGTILLWPFLLLKWINK